MDFDIDLIKRLLFRLIRQFKGYSIENVALAIPISKSALSNMENGKRTFSIQAFEAGMAHMNVHFDVLSIEQREDILDLVADFIRALYFLDDSQKQDVLQRFFKLHFNRQKDFHDGYFYLVFLEILVEIDQIPTALATEELQAPLINRLRYLERLIPDLPSDLQTLYALAILMWFTKSRQWDKSQRFFQTLNLDQEMTRFPGLIPLVAYYRTKSLAIAPNSMMEVHHLIHHLQDIAHRQRNYLRLMYLDFDEGVYLMSIGNYKEARSLFHQLQCSILPFSLSFLAPAIQDNLIWCYLMSQDFKQSLQKANQLEAQFGAFPNSNLVFQVYCFYRLGKIQEGQEALKRLKYSFSASDQDLQILNIFEPLLNRALAPIADRPKLLKAFCTRCEHHWRQYLDTLPATRELAIFFVRIQMYEVEQIEDYGEANRLCQILEELCQMRPKVEPLLWSSTQSTQSLASIET
ncbi:MAG: helix-turn-helix transcriptional regulator [Allobaculum sp.]|nr:helix-turn-helix transcriptional regulator [Allobaculum sp.]